MRTPSYHQLPGVHRAPNIQQNPSLYEVENQAADPEQRIEAAMAAIAPLTGRVVLDLGAGTGFHLERLHTSAQHLFAVEPDDSLRMQLVQRVVRLGLHNVSVLKGSAEYIPLRDQSIDICHARFAYFFAPNCLPGLRELERIMRPGGTAFIIDNDLATGTFAHWLLRAGYAKEGDAEAAQAFWAAQGFTATPIISEWRFATRADLEAVVQLEFGPWLAEALLADHQGLRIAYHYQLYHRTYR